MLNQTYANPTPSTVDLDLSAVLLSNSSYDPTLYAFQGNLHLGDSDTAFSGFEVPQMQGTNGSIAHVRQQVGIYDDDQFTQYTIAVLQNKTYTLHLKGKGELKVGGLPKTSVDYDKTIIQQGMQCLPIASIHRLTSDGRTERPGGSSNQQFPAAQRNPSQRDKR